MKNYLSFLIVLVFYLSGSIKTAEAIEINMQDAKYAASSKVKELTIYSRTVSLELPYLITDAEKVLGYMFYLEPEGFIIVSGTTELPPVIAYSTTGRIDTKSKNSSLFFDLLIEDLKLRLVNLVLLPSKIINDRKDAWQSILKGNERADDKTFEQWPPEGTTPTGGWLESNWTQNSPYNNFCPIDPVTLQRSVAGCPATAMGMIVNYYKTINNSILTDNDDYYHSYAGRNFWIDNDFEANGFPSFPDLNIFIDSLESRWINNQPLKPEHKAAITFACGVVAKQVYTSGGSGTFGVNQAYNAYIRFGFDECSLINDSDTSIYTKLAGNMMNARPAHLAIVTPAWDMGHNVVVDGYNTDNYFHLNFGWGGPYNAWYLLPDEIPYGLTVIEGLIIDIYDPVFTGNLEYTNTFNEHYINIYPNPTRDFINLDFKLTAGSNTKVELLNAQTGNSKLLCDQKLYAGQCNLYINLRKSEHLIGSVCNGLYLLKITTDEFVLYRKVLIQ